MENYLHLHLPPNDIRNISSIGLAHLGDAVYELMVRSWLCVHGAATGKHLHRAAVELVRAESQARRSERILPLLTEEEAAVFRRGRNANVHTIPHSASRADYLKANTYTRPHMVKYPQLKDAYGEVLKYIKLKVNDSDYDLEKQITEQMTKVDNARA